MKGRQIHYVTSRLKEFREARNWSQQELADFLQLQIGQKVSRSSVQKWENQERGLTGEFALEVARVTDIKIMDLVETRTTSRA